MISEVSVGVRADLSGLRDDMATVREEVVAELDHLEKTGETTGDPFRGARKGAVSTGDELRKLSSVVTSTAGVFTGLVGVGGLVVGVFVSIGKAMLESARSAKETNERYLELTNTIQKIDPGSAVANLDNLSITQSELRDRISESNLTMERQIELYDLLDDAAEKARKASRSDHYDKLAASARGAAADFKVLAESLTTQIEVNPFKIEEAEYLKTVDRINDMSERLDKARKSIIFSDPQEFARLTALQQDLEKSARKAADELNERNLQALTERLQNETVAIREQERLKDEAQASREAEADRRSQERIRRETEAIRESLNSISADYTTLINNLTGATRDVANALGRLK